MTFNNVDIVIKIVYHHNHKSPEENVFKWGQTCFQKYAHVIIRGVVHFLIILREKILLYSVNPAPPDMWYGDCSKYGIPNHCNCFDEYFLLVFFQKWWTPALMPPLSRRPYFKELCVCFCTYILHKHDFLYQHYNYGLIVGLSCFETVQSHWHFAQFELLDPCSWYEMCIVFFDHSKQTKMNNHTGCYGYI